MEVPEAELVALFAAWRRDIDAEPIGCGRDLSDAVRGLLYRQRYLAEVSRVLRSAVTPEQYGMP